MRGTTQAVETRARALRRDMTLAEIILWDELRRHRLDGLGFRRQHPMMGFIIDFYCPAKKLCVEVDGAVHDDPDQAARDAERTVVLEAAGCRVLRFRNDDVRKNLPAVLRTIREAAGEIR